MRLPFLLSMDLDPFERGRERLPELLVKTMKMAVAFTGEPGGRTVTDEIIASAKVNASFRIVNVEKKLHLFFHLPPFTRGRTE